MKKTLVSGIQSSGRLHLGNYFGALQQFVTYQNQYQSYFFVANYHALTTVHDADYLKQLTYDTLLDYLAVGLDPNIAVLYTQTHVPQVFELAIILQNLVTVPWLERAHAFKDKSAKGLESTVGLFSYPILMAADILLMKGEVVPVGNDQRQHLEMVREIARKFNHVFGEIFPEPQELIRNETAIVVGTDGQKMSKSYGNTIPLFASPQEIEKSVMSIVTGSNPKGSAQNPHDTLFTLLALFLTEEELHHFRPQYQVGELGYKDAKLMFIDRLNRFLEPLRERREMYSKHMDDIRMLIHDGEKRAQQRAQKTMEEVREKVGLV